MIVSLETLIFIENLRYGAEIFHLLKARLMS